MPIIVAFAATKRAGKNTAAAYMAEQLKTNHIHGFGDPLKAAVESLLPRLTEGEREGAKKETSLARFGLEQSNRQLTQMMSDFVHDIQPDFLLLKMRENINALLSLNINSAIIIHDIRYEYQAQYIRNIGGTVVHIDNQAAAALKDFHSSEQGIGINPDDLTVDNNGNKTHLYNQLNDVINVLKMRESNKKLTKQAAA